LLESLTLIQDVQPVGEDVSKVLPLAREYGLSAYDAAYLELSMRHGAPLATLDGKLQKATGKSGCEHFQRSEKDHMTALDTDHTAVE
jgi:predicted nucleic acid-binding protein